MQSSFHNIRILTSRGIMYAQQNLNIIRVTLKIRLDLIHKICIHKNLQNEIIFQIKRNPTISDIFHFRLLPALLQVKTSIFNQNCSFIERNGIDYFQNCSFIICRFSSVTLRITIDILSRLFRIYVKNVYLATVHILLGQFFLTCQNR